MTDHELFELACRLDAEADDLDSGAISRQQAVSALRQIADEIRETLPAPVLTLYGVVQL